MRKLVFPTMAGILFAFCYVAGYQLDRFDTLDFTDKGFYVKWALAAAGIAAALFFLWRLLDRWGEHRSERMALDAAAKGKRTGRMRLICAAVLFVSWIPTWLSLFPGAFSYDAFNEWEQVHNGMLTAHHPVAHVLLLGGLTEGSYLLTGSYNPGIGIYTLLQMLLFAWALSAVIAFMAEFGIPRFVRALTLVFYIVSPVVQLFSICATKDVLFSAAELIFFLYAVRICADRELAGNRKQMILFGLSALCTIVFRNNGIYIVILTLLVLGVVFRRELAKYGRNLLWFSAVVLIPWLLYVGPVYQVLHVEKGGIEEMLSVPLQQLARVYRYAPDSLSGEELETLYRFVDQEALEKYRPTVSDMVKQGFRGEEFQRNKGDFFRLWVQLGVKHPLTYVNSFLINTVDAWYPHALIDGYRHGDGRGSWFDYRVAPPGEERVYLPGLHELYESLSHDLEQQKKPLAFLFLSPGWYVICTAFFFFYAWSRRRYSQLAPMWIFVFHILTVLLGPVILVRYLLLFFLGLPVVCAMAFFPERFGKGRGDLERNGRKNGKLQASSGRG